MRVRLTITDADGTAVHARASISDKVSRAASILERALPIHERLRHVRWSGEAGYVLVPALRDPALELEDPMSFYCRGTIGLRPEHGEVTIAYGSAQARDWWGSGWAIRLGEIEGDADEFLAVVEKTQRSGVVDLEITRLESTHG
jgi:hypothetical protein